MNIDYTNFEEFKFQHTKPKNINGNERTESTNFMLKKIEYCREEVALRLEGHTLCGSVLNTIIS